jgi:hypothetical protein
MPLYMCLKNGAARPDLAHDADPENTVFIDIFTGAGTTVAALEPRRNFFISLPGTEPDK